MSAFLKQKIIDNLSTGKKDDKLVEYQDGLYEHFVYSCIIKDGNYMPPLGHGYFIEKKEKSVNTLMRIFYSIKKQLKIA